MLAELIITCVPWLTGETVCMESKGEFWKVRAPIERVVPPSDHHEFAPLILVAGLDLATTEVGLSRGLYETNMVAQSRPLMYASKALSVVLVDRWIVRLKKQKKPGHARVLKYGYIGLNLFAVGWNVRKIAQ